jgi:hypothetical protein
MDKNGMIGELLEQGQQTVLNTTKQAVSDVANSLKGQLGLPDEKNTGNATSVQNNTQNNNQVQSDNIQQGEHAPANEKTDDELTREMVKDFYSPSIKMEGVNVEHETDDQLQQKIEGLRKQLHDEVYYQPLINSKKDGQEAEEREADRVERLEEEEKKKKWELEQKQAKASEDIATTRAKTAVESNRGAAG